MLTSEQAYAIVILINIACDSDWPNTRAELLSEGINPGDILMATGQIAKIAGVDNPLGPDDFKD